jgi:hypothetical protein
MMRSQESSAYARPGPLARLVVAALGTPLQPKRNLCAVLALSGYTFSGEMQCCLVVLPITGSTGPVPALVKKGRPRPAQGDRVAGTGTFGGCGR